MQITAGSRYRCMPERRLNQVNRLSTFEGMARVGVTEGVDDDVAVDPGPSRRPLDDPQHL